MSINSQNMTLIHCSIFCRGLYKVPYIFYMLYFIMGFALSGTTAGVHQPEVEWPRSTACLCALNTASISSEMSYCTERHPQQDLQQNRSDIIFLLFPRITFFCFKINYEMNKVYIKYIYINKVLFQQEHLYSSWMKS